MKKFLIATVATAMSSALMASAAFADSTDSTSLDVTATVLPECSIEQPTAVTFAEVNINEGAGANALLLKNGSQSSSQNVFVSCNYATDITITSANDGLLNAAGAGLVASDPADFTNLINYRVLLNSTDGSFPNVDFRTRLEASETETSVGAFHDDALLRIVIDRDDTAKRPVAGDYTDTATITLGVI